jgi:virginiamycin B lyase
MRPACAALALAVLAACAGGSPATGGFGVMPGSGAPASAALAAPGRRPKREKAVVRFLIPKRVRSHRAPHFVSGATMGVQIVAHGAGLTITTVANLAPLSNNCTVQSGGARICTVATEVPVGNDTVTITTYDKPPSGGNIPGSANVLAIGSTTQQVTPGVTPSIVVYLGGVIGSIGASPAFASLPADGSNHNAAFAIAPQDFGNQPIAAGKNDPYNNPITATLTETGGSGHAVLLLNGKNTGSSATLQYSSDALEVKYDGGGSQGYLIKVAFAASGAPTQKTQVAPMFVSSTSPLYVNGRLKLQGLPASASVDVNEAGSPPASQTYTATRSGCSGIATVTTSSDTPSSATFAVTGGATASPAGTCTIAIGDGTSSIVLPVSNTTSGGGVGLPGSIVNVYTVPLAMPTSPAQIVVGPDQKLWYTTTSSAIQSIDTSGNFTNYDLTGALANTLTAGPDGAFWIADQANYQVVRYVPSSGTQTNYTYNNGALPLSQSPVSIVTGSDGYLWFTDCENDALDRMSITGNTTQVASITGLPSMLAQGPDNGMWFAEATDIGRVDMSSYALVQTPVSALPTSIAAGPDGAMWFAIPANDEVGRITTDGSFTITTYPTGAGTAPDIIARGPDGAMYFNESGTDKIGRIDVNTKAIASYAYPAGGVGPVGGIVAGPDNNVWYTLEGSNQIVQMTP